MNTAPTAISTVAPDVTANTDSYGNIVYSPLNEGDKAPVFTADLVGGGTFDLGSNQDKVVLISFWATWCNPCVKELPEFEKLSQENIQGFDMVLVNYSEPQSTVDAFISENNFTVKIAYDDNGSICDMYPTTGIPYTVILKNGIVRKIFVGKPRNPYETYKNAVQECLNG